MNMGQPSGQPWRPCFPARCPMCAQDTMFHLLVKLAGFEALVIGVTCPKCNYEVLADHPEEREKLVQASTLLGQHERGELEADAVSAALDDLGSTTLARIIAEARTWTCPGCDHENPLHFVTCWNCEYERPLTEDEQLLEHVDRQETDEGTGGDG